MEPEPQASETEDDKPRQEIKAAESGTAFRGKALAFALVIFVAAVVTSGGYKKFMGRNPGGGFIGLSTAPATQDKAPALSHLAEGALDSKTPAPSEGIDSLKLEGIFYRAGGSAALINGRSYVAGEQIKGMSIIAIERTNVVVEVGGQRQTLKLSSRKH